MKIIELNVKNSNKVAIFVNQITHITDNGASHSDCVVHFGDKSIFVKESYENVLDKINI
ncbi:hypothetical protein Q4595_16325 [Wenyingzhuangia sp. 1_MG-2023]|nr:hypothetical protein [Wenyingzhuangia sp. 1_MG-2023]